MEYEQLKEEKRKKVVMKEMEEQEEVKECVVEVEEIKKEVDADKTTALTVSHGEH